MIKKLFKFIIYLGLLIALIIAIGVFFPSTKVPNVGYTGNMYIPNITIVDTETGTLIPGQNVLVRDGIITGISGDNIRPVDEIIIIVDGNGKFLIPGLWDMHTQSIKRSPNFHHPLFIANGVTHLRDLSGCLNKDDNYWACTSDRKRWSRLATEKKAVSPNYHNHSTTPINGGNEIPNNFPKYMKIDSFEKADGLVKFGLSQEADFLTVHPELEKRPYFGVAVEAAKNGLSISGNKPISANLQEALATYQRSFDEPWLFATECYANASDYRNANDPLAIYSANTRRNIVNKQNAVQCSALMTAMAASSSSWTPSISQVKYSAFAHKRSFNKNENNKYVSLFDRFVSWPFKNRSLGLSAETSSDNAHTEFYDLIKKQTGLANWAGVNLLAGTKSGSPYTYSGFTLHDELGEMVDSGLSELQALRAATFNAAVFSRLSDDFGSIRIGKKADFLLLDANPLENINNTKKINAVISNQMYYDRESLDKLLAFSEKQALSWHMNIKLLWDTISSPLKRQQLKNDYKRGKE
jgi:hypothetical protein